MKETSRPFEGPRVGKCRDGENRRRRFGRPFSKDPTHGNPRLVAGSREVGSAAYPGINRPTSIEPRHDTWAAGCERLPILERIEDGIPGIFLRPHSRQAAWIPEERPSLGLSHRKQFFTNHPELVGDIVFADSPGRGHVGIRASDKTKRIRVYTNPLLLTKAFQQCITDKIGARRTTPGRLRAPTGSFFTIFEFLLAKITGLFEIAEFIRRTHDAVHSVAALALSLDLHHFNDGLETRAQGCLPALLLQGEIGVLNPEHLTIGEVRVVRNGNRFAARFRIVAKVHQLMPKIHFPGRFEGRNGQLGHDFVPENYVSVHLR